MNRTKLRPYLLLFFLVSAVYWPISIFQIQYDFLDCWLPWRHFISKSFHNGIFPLWNPYQQLGYPIHADLQGPVFSFENFITGNLFHVNLFTLQMLVFSYLLLAAFGMYKLCTAIYQNYKTAIIISFAFAGGGMFVHHLQHFFSMISFACFPITIYFFWQLLQLHKWKYVFGLVPLLALQFTTGNQTFNIINFHIFFFEFLLFAFQYYKAGYIQGLKKIAVRCLILFFLTLLSIAPVLISYWQTKNLVLRYEGISYDKIAALSMSNMSFTGFVNPFITTQQIAIINNDPSMTGVFIGFILLISSFGFFIFSQNRYKLFLFLVMLFFLLMATGNNFPFHYAMVKIDPLLGLFRVPSYYMFYVCFILLIASGYFLKDIFIGKIEFKKFLYLILGLTLVYTGVFLFIAFDTGSFFNYISHFNFTQAFKSLSFSNSFSISYIVLFFITIVFLVLYVVGKVNYKTLFTITIIELILIGNLNLLSTVSDRKIKKIDDFLAKTPDTFGLITNKVIDDNTYIKNYPEGIWRNKEMYLNIVSSEFFNSFYLNPINNYLDSNGKLNYKHDLIQCQSPYNIIKFLPGEIVVEVNADTISKLEVLQMNTPQWKLYINNKNSGTMQGDLLNTKLKKGKSIYRFVYENKWVVFFFWVSYIMCFLMIIGFFYLQFKNNFRWILFAATVLIFMIPAVLFLW